MLITKTGNYALLAKKPADIEDCFKAWEEILQKNSKVCGSFEYQNYFELSQGYAQFLSDYVTSKAILIKLRYVIDDEDIAWLAERGYRVNADGGYSDYMKSLYIVGKQTDNLRTKIKSRFKELKDFGKTGDAPVESYSFQEVLANLNANLSFSVNEDITLAAYNEYRRIIKVKQKQNGGLNR
jgi:hypothetical protein